MRREVKEWQKLRNRLIFTRERALHLARQGAFQTHENRACAEMMLLAAELHGVQFAPNDSYTYARYYQHEVGDCVLGDWWWQRKNFRRQ